MAAHLSHKIRWNLLADYLTPYSDHGIAFPVGECGRIHATKKKHKIQIEMRKYISDDMICTAKDCEVKGEKVFRKTYKKGSPFGVGEKNEEKLKLFLENFCSVIYEFATTELKSPVKTIEYHVLEDSPWSFTHCPPCNKFISYLEFGDKQKLFEYSEADLRSILQCLHGGQAVGNSIAYVMYHVLKFYVYSNVIVHLDLRSEDRWPAFMRPNSNFRQHILFACDGQTFLPHSRKYLAQAMIDLNETRTLSKNLFRFIYFYAMMRMRLDSSYNLRDDIDRLSYFLSPF